MNKSRGVGPRAPRGRVMPKTFMPEGRESIKKKHALLAGKLFDMPNGLELKAKVAGCVGVVKPGTIIRFNLSRITPVGKMYFFDGFEIDRSGDLRWIGEFDTMNIDEVAIACGKSIAPSRYNKVFMPDTRGALHETTKTMVVE